MKRAVLSIDVEDWYHLDYFRRDECDTRNSLLDGLDVYVALLESLSLKSSFFVLGEIAETKIEYFKALADAGHDIGSHGWGHKRPMTMGLNEFQADLRRCSAVMTEINGDQRFGYRAPCFSLDRERLDIVRDSGFAYDSSRINFGSHPLYGSLDMHGYDSLSDVIYREGDFFEFEATTLSILGQRMPISGGGYLRLLPWALMKGLISQYLKGDDLYVLYIHPFELSPLSIPPVPDSTSALTRFRYSHGRKGVVEKIKRLVAQLRSNGYIITTFSELQKEMSTSERD